MALLRGHSGCAPVGVLFWAFLFLASQCMPQPRIQPQGVDFARPFPDRACNPIRADAAAVERTTAFSIPLPPAVPVFTQPCGCMNAGGMFVAPVNDKIAADE